MFSIKFSDAAAVLADVGTVTVAEAHGCLCGALCGSNHYSFARWFDELSADWNEPGGDNAIVKDIIETLYKETVRAMRGDDMEFAPFLPDDEAPLARRAEALAQWCQGFLYGFGSVSGTQRNLPAAVEEVLRDLTQIARAGAGDTDPTEEDEADYVEIVEYVRVGAQLVHDELRSAAQ